MRRISYLGLAFESGRLSRGCTTPFLDPNINITGIFYTNARHHDAIANSVVNARQCWFYPAERAPDPLPGLM